MKAYERLLRYVIVRTPSDETVETHPSSHCQFNLARILEAEMDVVMQAVQLGRACRSTANIKVRQALSTLYVKGSKLSDACAALIRDELNGAVAEETAEEPTETEGE